MKLLLLEISRDQQIKYRALHSSDEAIEHELHKFVEAYWDEVALQKAFRDYNVEDAIDIFFDQMPGYNYEIAPLSMDDPEFQPAQDPHKNMDSVVLEPAELDLIRCALGNTQYKILHSQLRASAGQNVSLEKTQAVVHALREKLR